MLSLPSVSSTQTVVSRPFLVSDAAARATNVVRAIEPTTAVSKERSKVEVRVPDGLAQVSAQPSASSGIVATPVRQATTSNAAVGSNAPQPPGERSAVQKAMDTQINELFSTVWKASAKAVDFLLGRPEPTAAQVAAASEPMSAIMWSLTAPAGSKFSQASLASAQAPSSASTSDTAPIVYSSRGSSTSQSAASRGALLDVLA